MGRADWKIARLIIRNLERDGAVAIDPDVAQVQVFNPSSRPEEPRLNRSLAVECPFGRWHPHNVVGAKLENSARIPGKFFGQPTLFEASNRLKVSVVEHGT